MLLAPAELQNDEQWGRTQKDSITIAEADLHYIDSSGCKLGNAEGRWCSQQYVQVIGLSLLSAVESSTRAPINLGIRQLCGTKKQRLGTHCRVRQGFFRQLRNLRAAHFQKI
jgi:hypothetical protein